MRQGRERRRLQCTFVALAIVGAGLAAASPAAVAQNRQTEPAADEIMIQLDFDLHGDFTPFDQLTFETRCDGLEDPQVLVISVDELIGIGPFRFSLVKGPKVTTCSVALLEDLPAGWILQQPTQNPLLGVGPGSLIEWDLVGMPEGMGLFRMEIHAQIDSLDVLVGNLPAFVSYSCSGSPAVHTRAWPGFEFQGYFLLFDAFVDGTLTFPVDAVLQKTVTAPPGNCSAWTTTRPGSGVYLSGGATMAVNEGELSTMTFVSRAGSDEPFLCDGQPATIVGTAGDDVMRGTSGPDVIWADAGDDRVYGGGGADLICGGEGNDQLWGNAGKDRLLGQHGNDILRGGRGRDDLVGGRGNDVADGAIHIDTCVAEFTRRCE